MIRGDLSAPSAAAMFGSPLMKPTPTSATRPRAERACATRRALSFWAPGVRSPWAAISTAARAGLSRSLNVSFRPKHPRIVAPPAIRGQPEARAALHPWRRRRFGSRARQARFALPEHRGIEFSPVEGVERAIEDTLELRAIIGDQQQIGAGVERFHDRRAEIAAIDRAHHQIVGHDHALVIPFPADDAVDHALRMRCGVIRIDRLERD